MLHYICLSPNSRVASRGRGGVPPLTAKTLPKIGKRGKDREKRKNRLKKENRVNEEKSRRLGNNREGSFTLPRQTERSAYATESKLKAKMQHFEVFHTCHFIKF